MQPSDLPGRLPRHIVVDDNGCWLWTGYIHVGGYAHANFQQKMWRVHRLAYTLLVGSIPEGLVTDHTCNVQHCVNPGHIDIVTQAENQRRRSLRQTHCKWGHERTDNNVYLNGSRYRRVCKECHKVWMATYNARRENALKAAA